MMGCCGEFGFRRGWCRRMVLMFVGDVSGGCRCRWRRDGGGGGGGGIDGRLWCW